MTCLVTLFDRKLQVFKNSPKWTIFGIFNQLLSTQNVNVARLARNVEWDFFCDFQTPCKDQAFLKTQCLKVAQKSLNFQNYIFVSYFFYQNQQQQQLFNYEKWKHLLVWDVKKISFNDFIPLWSC